MRKTLYLYTTLLLVLLAMPGLMSAQKTEKASEAQKQEFLRLHAQRTVTPSEEQPETPRQILERYRRGSLAKSVGNLTWAKMQVPVCELRADDEAAHSFVAPPDNFKNPNVGQAKAGSDCSSVEVTYNFPPEISQDRRDQFIFAYEYAVAIWESQISSPVTIKVEANFLPLGPGILGSAGPNRIWNDGTAWYADALIDQIFGTDVAALFELTGPDIVSNFSTSFGWYLGTDGNAPPGTFDFVTVALHELGHGLGFFGSGFAISDLGLGVYGQSGLPYVYDLFVEDGNGTTLFDLGPPGTVSPTFEAYLTSGNLFVNSPSVVGVLGAPGKIYTPAPFRPGSSYSHWDEAAFPTGTPNSLMTPFLSFQEANHDPGANTLAMFSDHGWTLSTDCAGPTPTDLSERCDITGISFDLNFAPGPVCDNPGVFSANGGAFGPVGSHVACFRVEGVDPFNQPLDPDDYEVKIKGKTYPILASRYSVIDGEAPYFSLCVGGVPSDGKKNLQVKIKLAPGCTYTEPSLYDSPDCGQPKLQIAESRNIVKGELTAFPNPSRGLITVNTGTSGAGQIFVLNGYGQRVLQRVVSENQQLDLDLSGQAGGVYYIQLVNGKEQQVRKIVINR